MSYCRWALSCQQQPPFGRCLVARTTLPRAREHQLLVRCIGQRSGTPGSSSSSAKNTLAKTTRPRVAGRWRKRTLRSSKDAVAAEDAVKSSSSVSSSSPALNLPLTARLQQTFGYCVKYFMPIRYQNSFQHFTTQELLTASAYRLALWLILITVGLHDQIAVYSLQCSEGPSMLPTIAAECSDIWLVRNHWLWLYELTGWTLPIRSIQRNDIITWSHPDEPQKRFVKRVIGVENDSVPRYGTYAYLFLEHDPSRLGIQYPDDYEKKYPWFRNRRWDDGAGDSETPTVDEKEPTQVDDTCEGQKDISAVNDDYRRTIVVPPDHVWLEGDNPGMAMDSRHYGPIPISWIRNKIVARVWPFRKRHAFTQLPTPYDDYQKRPHPIRLDDESLSQHNVYRLRRKQSKNDDEQEQ